MIYHGTYASETIEFYTVSRPDIAHWIEMTKSADDPTFFVTCCCDPDWHYEFYMENNSDYERVKMTIMDAIFNCENPDALIDELSEIFEDGFMDILVENDGCDGDCDNCSKYFN